MCGLNNRLESEKGLCSTLFIAVRREEKENGIDVAEARDLGHNETCKNLRDKLEKFLSRVIK